MKDSEYLEMPWSIEDTIENLSRIKEMLKRTLVNANMDGKAESDVKELEFDFDRAIQALEEVEQYQAIGTIERFRELTEKAEPKKPIYSEFDENELGEVIPYKATCPTCGFEFEFGTWNDEENHHCECGQCMNWE